MSIPTFLEDGSLNPETISIIKNWDCINNGTEELMKYVMGCWNYHYGKIQYGKRDNRKTITFITGGWSENEYVLSALEQNIIFYPLLWHSSYRGGKTIFYMPEHKCKPQPIKYTCCCCSMQALEPDEDCPKHGCPYPPPKPRCPCGKFVPLETDTPPNNQTTNY